MNEYYNLNTRKVIKAAAVVLAVLLGVFITFKLSFYLAPFIIAFAISTLMEPIIRFLIFKLRIRRKIAALIALLFILVTFGLILTLVIIKLISEIKSIAFILPKYLSELYNNIIVLINKGTDMYQWLPDEITSNVGAIISNVSNSLMKIVNSIVGGAFATVISLPEALIFTLVTILSTYFLSSDRDRIYNFFKAQLPASWLRKVTSIKNDMFSALFGYIRAQLILMSITFTELFIGFSIIHIKYPLVLAFFISIIDALPIVGTGSILIPWSIYEFLIGNFRLGVSIIILYIIVLIIRQLIEPKILGHQIGVYPLLTLMSMYAGLKLLGFAGLILGPITFLLLKNIFSGLLKGRTIKEMLTGDTKTREKW